MLARSRFPLLALLATLSLLAAGAGAQTVSGPFGPLLDPWMPHHPTAPAWAIVPTPSPGADVFNALLYGVAALTDQDVWAVGTDSATSPTAGPETLIEHWDGVLWSPVPSPDRPDAENTLSAVAFTSPRDGWAVGYSKSATLGTSTTLVEHWNGSDWRILQSPNLGSGFGSASALTCVSAVDADDVWAAGYGINPLGGNPMLLEHWDGAQWSIVAPPPALGSAKFVMGIDARAADDVWAVGYDASSFAMTTVAAHWNGTAWAITQTPNVGGAFTPDCKLLAVKAVAANDVWAVGGANNINQLNLQQTIIEHWNGTAWSLVPSPNPDTGGSTLHALAIRNAHDVWAVGNTHNFNTGFLSSLTMRWNGTSWSVVPSPSGFITTILWSTAILPSGTAWAVGSTEVQGQCCLRTLAMRTANG